MTAYIENPFTILYNALWDMAFQSNLLRSLVKEGNRIGFGSETNRNPIKETLSAADVPELELWSLGTSGGNLHNSSSTSLVSRNFGFVIRTGDYRLNPFLHQVEWELVCSLANWQPTLGNLLWQGERFILKANLLPSSVQPASAAQARGLAGWMSMWSCTVDLKFPTAQLITNLKQEIE